MNKELIPELTSAIIREASLRKSYLKEPVTTIYFGGGTPSLLAENELTGIMMSIAQLFNLTDDAEITLEANPDDITKEKLQLWKRSGINRLSIGIQSFFEEDLVWMGRAHNAIQAENAIQRAKDNGFENISIDLIYGGPTLSNSHWEANLAKAIEFQIPHLSCYALTVEPKTILSKKIKDRRVEDIDTEKQADHFSILMEKTASAGYEQYEISNFALPGKRSRHNSSYWSGEHYLGLGPSAHSFNGVSRQWNIANNSLYISAINNETIPSEEEVLTQMQQVNEYIMTALRTSAGVDLHRLGMMTDEVNVQKLLKEANRFFQNETLIQENNHLIIPNKGKFYADGIAAALFLL